MFAGFALADEHRAVGDDGTVVHGVISATGGSWLVNVDTGGWVVGDERLYRSFVAGGVDALLSRNPVLREPLQRQIWRRSEFREINPWTLKVADHCNMGCSYCYENAQPLTKNMTLETARKVVEEMLSTRQQHYTVLFHGGEPSLNMPVVRQVVAELRRGMPSTTSADFIMHTNLLHFPPDLQRELVSLGVKVGTSIDGPRNLHDRHRVNLAGRGTHDAVARNLARLDYRYVITTVTRANHAELLATARHLVEDLRVHGFHFLPLLPHGREGVQALRPDPDVMASSVLEVFDYVLEQRTAGLPVRFRNLDDVVRSMHSMAYIDACQPCVLGEFRSQSITINYDGSFGPCDITAGYPEYQLGSVQDCREDIAVRMFERRNFRMFKLLDNIEPCNTCAFKHTCAGGCEEESERPGYQVNSYCRYYYTVHAAVATNLLALERLGHSARILRGNSPYQHAVVGA